MTTAVVGYYQLDQSEGHDAFTLVLKEFWDANQSMDDSGSEEEFVPEGFYALCEGVYEHDLGGTDVARQALEAAGWVEKNMF